MHFYSKCGHLSYRPLVLVPNVAGIEGVHCCAEMIEELELSFISPSPSLPLSFQSHNDLEVGESVDRNYDWSKFKRDTKYGMETPHDNRGTLVSSALDWRKNTCVCACVHVKVPIYACVACMMYACACVRLCT